MNSIVVILIFGIVLSLACAEPIRYRQTSPVRASARQTDNGLAFEAELGSTSTTENSADEESSEQPTESAPYQPSGWKPFGQLFVLPYEVKIRQNLESTSTVESSTFDDEQATTTTETPATDASPKGELNEFVETSEPKMKKAAFRRPPLKFSGALKVEAAKESNAASSTTTTPTTTTTESNDEVTETTTVVLGELETTSEPDSEAVDTEKSEDESQQSTDQQDPQMQSPQAPAFFVQLPDGSYQRVVYLQPAQAAFIPQPQQQPQSPNFPFQQLVQPQAAQPAQFGFNPITNPRIVTFSTAYQAF